MSFRENVKADLQTYDPSAVVRVGAVRPIGSRLHVDGMVDSVVKLDYVHLDFQDGDQGGRILGGMLYGVEAPSAPDDPLRLHFIESKASHARTAEAIGRVSPYIAAILPIRESDDALFGVLYYVDEDLRLPLPNRRPPLAEVQLFFMTPQETGQPTVDVPTAKSITAALMNTIGRSLLQRVPEIEAVTYFISYPTDVTPPWDTIRRYRVERGLTAADIKDF